MTKETQTQAIAEPFKFKNAALLNRLSEMAQVPYYATACHTLIQAEMAIVELERENATLRAEVERLAAQSAPTEDAMWNQTLQERDTYHDWADKLAEGIAAHLGIEIGEHSAGMGSAESNNPWANALEAIQSAAQSATSMTTEHFNKLADALESYTGDGHGYQIDDAVLREAARILRAAGAADVGGLMRQAQVFADAYTEWANYPTNRLEAQHDAARAALESALRLALVGREWQPIETAPKDGRQLILLLTPSGFPQVAYSNTWWTAGFSVECKPTHWMPLPAAAPQAKDQTA